MFVEKDYVTEKTAYAVQCLTLANIWKNCKDSGMEMIEINGEKKPVGEILSQVPGLRDTVEKNRLTRFLPNLQQSNPASSAHWDKHYLPGYSEGQFSDAAENPVLPPI